MQKYREAGNEQFKLKQFNKALVYYEKALSKISGLKESDENKNQNDSETQDLETQPENSTDKEMRVKLLCNAALCAFNLKEFAMCDKFTSDAYDLDRNNIKVIYRHALSLHKCGETARAYGFLHTCSVDIDIESNKILSTLEKQLRQHMNESESHYYAVGKDIDSKKMNDVANYYSDSFAIQYINDTRGRGIVATKNIAKDTIILVEKAFAMGKYHTPESAVQATAASFNLDVEANTVYLGKHIQLIHSILDKLYYRGMNCNFEQILFEKKYCSHFIQKRLDSLRLSMLFNGDSNACYKNEKRVKRFNKLFPCVLNLTVKNKNKQKTGKTEENNIYLFRFETSANDKKRVKKVLNKMVDNSGDDCNTELVTVRDINGIVNSNAFSTMVSYDAMTKEMRRELEKSVASKKDTPFLTNDGLWLTGSFFNHSEQPNAQRENFDNLMFVKATKDIKIGEEICIMYRPQFQNETKKQRKKLFKSTWGIDL